MRDRPLAWLRAGRVHRGPSRGGCPDRGDTLPVFRWLGHRPPQAGEARALAALAALEQQLGLEGWERFGQGEAWYARRFRRRADARRDAAEAGSPFLEHELTSPDTQADLPSAAEPAAVQPVPPEPEAPEPQQIEFEPADPEPAVVEWETLRLVAAVPAIEEPRTLEAAPAASEPWYLGSRSAPRVAAEPPDAQTVLVDRISAYVPRATARWGISVSSWLSDASRRAQRAGDEPDAKTPASHDAG